MDLNYKTAIVTGGTSGIGLATAIKLKEKGAEVIITGRNEARMKEHCDKFGFEGHLFDVSDEESVLKFYKDVTARHPRVDILINNAAYGYFKKLTDTDTSRFIQLMNANVTGAMMMAREAAKIFIRQNYGDIINIASTAAVRGFENGTAYVASKFALRGMTECWRAELRKHNIRVMLINPSEVQTEFFVNSGSGPKDFNPTKLIADDIAHAIISALEMNDRGFVTELTVFATNPNS